MCGIAGIYNLDSQPIALATLRQAADLLRHRGPDDEGFALFDTRSGASGHFKGPDSPGGVNLPDIRDLAASSSVSYDLGLAERRLAILDLSPAGHTPMTTPDGALTIAFNGEIYNFVELRAELTTRGCVFHSSGDTEVLLAAYAEWGPDCVRRFNGMWAFAIWDARNKHLFCARDRFGIKPFYYISAGRRFAFASEPKALWRSGLIAPRPNVPLLEDFIVGYDSPALDESMFEGVRQLPGGHRLTVSPAGIQIERFWSLPVNPDLGPAQPEPEPAARVRELLTDAVRLRLRSDVAVGSCLSGGLDSSAIVCIANQLMRDEHNIPRALAGAHQKVFTAAYEDDFADERRFARLVVDRTGAAWQVTFPTAQTLLDDLERFIWHHDEPIIGTSVYAQWCVMRLVRQHDVTVLLDGQGADELMGGYLPYDIYLTQIFRAAQLGRFVREAQSVAAIGSRPLREVLVRVAANQLPATIQQQLQLRRRDRMLGVQPAVARRATQRHQIAFDGDSRSNLPRHLQALALNNLPRLLRHEDRNSMAFSVEARTPFLDVRLAEYVSQLPAVNRIHAGWSKYVLRKAAEPLIPAEICWRRDKKGFVTPETSWMRTLRPVLLDLFLGQPRTAQWIDVTAVRSALQDDARLDNRTAAATLWRLAAAEIWLRMLAR